LNEWKHKENLKMLNPLVMLAKQEFPLCPLAMVGTRDEILRILQTMTSLAEALGATVHVAFETGGQTAPMNLSESKIPYRVKKHKG
jgi:hypothetical protein